VGEFVPVCKENDCHEGEIKGFTLKGKRIFIAKSGGKFFSSDSICTHAGGPLEEGYLEEKCIMCPLHGAQFDIETGAVLTPPAVRPLATHKVKVEGEQVFVEL